ncbi:MAG: Bax inhibitor-1/YccA family protein [Gammaproteobacteria bacterium]|nr:Bax inhibitor-1/YccA family protein [Gammaproteobacteria bacterium]MBU1655686.1 Bax inhibitor-1/YccA family protein [Gammaproteobacteria bacterium]MBU1961174.1 Bax inhibitor-1/YccA family protein [Gammaproteobacteria bacterium]
MNRYNLSVERAEASVLSTNKLVKNTYMLLSATLIWSALLAVVSMALAPSPFISLATSLGALALMWFVLPRTAETANGIWVVFAVTGLLGFGLGPMLNHYAALSNGAQIIATAFGGTGVIFLGLSGYALTTKRDFSFMGGFIFAGMLVVMFASLIGLFFPMPALSLAISSVVILLMSGYILFETSQMVNGIQTNYIMATVSLYLSILNIFTSLLHLLGVLGDD